MQDISLKLQEFIENEARSCSIDFGCVTPEYVYRMWGGQVPLNEIEEAFRVHGSMLMVNGSAGSGTAFTVNLP